MKLTIQALSPINHGEVSSIGKTDNISFFRKLPTLYNNQIYQVPAISGNSIRGVMRRLIVRELIDKYNLKDIIDKKYEKFYVALACGGALEKKLAVDIDPEKIRSFRTLLPMLSVFGTALYTYMVSGMVNIGFAKLKCIEVGTGEQHISDLIADIGEVSWIESDTNPSKMPYEFETIICGAEFEFDITFAPQATPVEISCINHGANMISVLGARSATGYGRVKIKEKLDDSLYVEWFESIDDDYIEKIKQFARDL